MASPPKTPPLNDELRKSNINSEVHQTSSSEPSTSNPQVKSLSPADLRQVCFSIGAPYFSIEQPTPKPTLVSWNSSTPPLPAGLYASVISLRKRSRNFYYFTTILYNTLLIFQLLFSAANTALAARSPRNGTALIILTALTTIDAGIVALLHNSGLPNRLRNDWSEYDKVEMYLVEVMSGGVVLQGQTWQDVVQSCFDKFAAAKATVQANKPSFYSLPASGTDAGTDAGTNVGNDGPAGKGTVVVDKSNKMPGPPEI